jgi:hypothetical protein
LAEAREWADKVAAAVRLAAGRPVAKAPAGRPAP